MNFISTRDKNSTKYTASQVIKQGLANDGGLFVPTEIPQLTKEEILSFTSLSYPELAATILSKFLTDYSYDELLEDCKDAYSQISFPDGACPLKKINENTYSLELWHGPTCAFKDMALQIMPKLLSRALVKTGENKTALVLVATSGDTGKAALEGYKDVPQIKICVFYPKNGVSKVQELQMTTQNGSNVNVCSVKGNFDDIQTGVKQIFNNAEIVHHLDEKGFLLSSANSINFGRLAPQIVYYIKSYCELLSNREIEFGEKINVCVPTGNFGNILAAYIAKLMGLPINKLICASNSNNILTDFLNTGRYDRNREFHLTMSPSMDILISSNLERLLYFVSGTEQTAEYMQMLNENGFYQVSDETKEKIDENFLGYFAKESQTSATIKKYYSTYNYLMDTHTAVAFSALESYRTDKNDVTKTVVASTASPYKFAKSVYQAIFGKCNLDGLEMLNALSVKTNTKIPMPLYELDKKKVNFNHHSKPENMYDEVLEFLEN